MGTRPVHGADQAFARTASLPPIWFSLDNDAVLLANGRFVVVSVDPGLNTGRRVTDEWIAGYALTDVVGTEFSIAVPSVR